MYHTDPNDRDTDNDGYSDWQELNSGYSPHNPKSIKLEDNDHDNDGLPDHEDSDDDGDGIPDIMES